MLTLKLLRYGMKGHIALEANSWQELAEQAATLFPLNSSHDFMVLWTGRLQPLRQWIINRGIRDPWITQSQQFERAA